MTQLQARFIVGILLCFPAISGAADESPSNEQPSGRERWQNRWKSVEEWAKTSHGHFVCAGIGFVGTVLDGPQIWFVEETRKPLCVLSMVGKDVPEPGMECPPVEWTAQNCNDKYRAYQLSKLPDIDDREARAIGLSQSGCNNPRGITCEVTETKEGVNWVFTIHYIGFASRDNEEWAKRFGLSRVVIGRKGEVVAFTWYYPNPEHGP